MTLSIRYVSCLALVLACACAEPESGPPICSAPCEAGLFFSECGDDGDRTLACHEITGRCRWITGGCVPADMRAIECPVSEPCCHRSLDGTWPYSDNWAPSGTFGVQDLIEDIAVLGSVPVTSVAPNAVSVVEDASVREQPPSVSCAGAGTDVLEICRDGSLTLPVTSRTDRSVVVQFRSRVVAGQTLYLELVAALDGIVGRVFLRDSDDTPSRLMLACEVAMSPAFSATGSARVLVRDASPDTVVVHGELSLTTSEGGVVDVRF